MIVKKIFGWTLILVSIFLSFIMLGITVRVLENIEKVFNHSVAEGTGFLIGYLLMIGFFGLLIFFGTKWGLKLIRNQKKSEDPIDQIGEL